MDGAGTAVVEPTAIDPTLFETEVADLAFKEHLEFKTDLSTDGRLTNFRLTVVVQALIEVGF